MSVCLKKKRGTSNQGRKKRRPAGRGKKKESSDTALAKKKPAGGGNKRGRAPKGRVLLEQGEGSFGVIRDKRVSLLTGRKEDTMLSQKKDCGRPRKEKAERREPASTAPARERKKSIFLGFLAVRKREEEGLLAERVREE